MKRIGQIIINKNKNLCDIAEIFSNHVQKTHATVIDCVRKFYGKILVQVKPIAPMPIWQATLRESGSQKRKGIFGNMVLSSSANCKASSLLSV